MAGHELTPLVDESAFLGLGDAVHGGGSLGSTARGELAATLERYAGSARDLGATSIVLLGTEPLRRAADAARIVHEVGRATGVPFHVLSHEEEAYLTLIGVTEARPVRHETLVIDIGGGSSEFAFVGPGDRARAMGLRLGSAWLTQKHVRHDPPTPDEIAAMTLSARELLADAGAALPHEIVGVGGTASNLVKLLPDAFLDRTLTRERIAEIQSLLVTQTAAAVAERYLVKPIRARLLPAGAAVIDAILERYRLDVMRVSKASLREGAILAVLHAGPSWRDRLSVLAHGWRS